MYSTCTHCDDLNIESSFSVREEMSDFFSMLTRDWKHNAMEKNSKKKKNRSE